MVEKFATAQADRSRACPGTQDRNGHLQRNGGCTAVLRNPVRQAGAVLKSVRVFMNISQKRSRWESGSLNLQIMRKIVQLILENQGGVLSYPGHCDQLRKRPYMKLLYAR